MPDHRHREQVLRRARQALWLIALLVAVSPLAACGKKPNQVDPPPGAEDSPFPRTYPDPATDPSP